MFQSRYRAASHFRSISNCPACTRCRVSISLSSGFSFQEEKLSALTQLLASGFNLVIERLLISGIQHPKALRAPVASFNLVIERLLISGQTATVPQKRAHLFQSRYRAASHFRARESQWMAFSTSYVSISLSSGFSFQEHCKRGLNSANHVSISLSSGFSFQVRTGNRLPLSNSHMFQSRYRAASHFRKKAKP